MKAISRILFLSAFALIPSKAQMNTVYDEDVSIDINKNNHIVIFNCPVPIPFDFDVLIDGNGHTFFSNTRVKGNNLFTVNMLYYQMKNKNNDGVKDESDDRLVFKKKKEYDDFIVYYIRYLFKANGSLSHEDIVGETVLFEPVNESEEGKGLQLIAIKQNQDGYISPFTYADAMIEYCLANKFQPLSISEMKSILDKGKKALGLK